MLCPFCKEEIADGAIKCKHCQTMLTPVNIPEQTGNKPQQSVSTLNSTLNFDEQYCSSCGAVVKKAAQICPKCGVSNFNKKTYSGLSDKWAWTLACVPLTIAFILDLFIVYTDETFFTIGTIVAIILNCVFVTLDYKELKRNDINASNWIWLGFLLIPVYMFMRAKKTNKHYGYAILWCAIFVITILMDALFYY